MFGSTMGSPLAIPVEVVERRIYLIRGHKVMLDADLAGLYQVATGNLNLAVRRNMDRVPEDFMFQLSEDEMENLILQNAISRWGGRRYRPYAFTEHGVTMLSSVLRSKRAVEMSILVVRAFVRLREMLASNKDLAARVEKLKPAQKNHASVINLLAEEIHDQNAAAASGRAADWIQGRLVFQDHHRHGLAGSVGQRKRHVANAPPFRDLGGLSMEFQRWTSGREVGHFKVPPCDAMPSGAQGFHSSFFGGEAGSVSLEWVGFALGVSDLSVGEHTCFESRSVAFHGRAHSTDFAQIDACSNDQRAAPVVVMVRQPCLTPLVEISASASF